VNCFFTVVDVPVNRPVAVDKVIVELVVLTIHSPIAEVNNTGLALALVVPIIEPVAVVTVVFTAGVLAVILPVPAVNTTADPVGVVLIVKSVGELTAEI
jgi:hypothetical protein